MCYFFICFDYIKERQGGLNMFSMKLILSMMLAAALYAAFDALAIMLFDDDEEEEGD